VLRTELTANAGGYDPRMQENVAYHKELENIASELKLKHKTVKSLESPSDVSTDVAVLFLLSVPETLKQSLLDSADLLIYTPRNEHFGIVPLEAMLNGVPVLAANEGGPLETVVEGETGWLRDVMNVSSWTEVMQKVISETRSDPEGLKKMGQAGRARVIDKFSQRKMALNLNQCLDELKTAKRPEIVNVFAVTAVAVVLFATVFGVILMFLLFYLLERDEKLEQLAKARQSLPSTSTLSASISSVMEREL